MQKQKLALSADSVERQCACVSHPQGSGAADLSFFLLMFFSVNVAHGI